MRLSVVHSFRIPPTTHGTTVIVLEHIISHAHTWVLGGGGGKGAIHPPENGLTSPPPPPQGRP